MKLTSKQTNTSVSHVVNNHTPSGQVAIVILLIMVVLLTVGLSLATRTTQELFLSQQESESARVFNAAEVGVEGALSQDFSTITGTITLNDPKTVSNVSTTTTIQPSSNLETQLVEGSAVHLDLTNWSGNLTIDWGKESGCAVASLLISIYYDDPSSGTEVIHETFGPPYDGGDPDCQLDDFQKVSTNNPPYSRSTTITIPADTLFARIRAVYSDTPIRVSGIGLPTQFYTIRSQASTDIGEESRTVEVGRTLSGAPSFMDYSLYSGAGITQDDGTSTN